MQNWDDDSSSQGKTGEKVSRVLLVTGSELLTFSLENLFKDSCVLLTSVKERRDGLKHFNEDMFDAVITDICRDMEEGMLLRRELRSLDEKVPILFMTPPFFWSDVRLLDKIVEDPHSYYIPENVDRKFMLAKLRQVIHSYHAEGTIDVLRSKRDRNLYLAGMLQKAMLPPWVYFSEDYEFSVLYRPFFQVSGDLFEWLVLDEGKALFVFGDVSGHGTHSALAMTAAHSFLKQMVMLDKERAAQPSLLAADINDFFFKHLHNIVYMCTLIAYIDFKNNFIRYQNSGFIDILCVDSDTGEITNINPERKGSVPLGMMRDAIYTEKDDVEYHFKDSSVFLICSDGLMDLSKDKEGNKAMDFSMCRKLTSMLVRDAHKEEKSIALPFRCLHSLEQFGYTFPQDDLSMFMIRKPKLNEHEYVFSFRAPADKAAVDRICQKASAFVENYYQDPAISVSAELVLEEYLVNVIMYGLDEYEKLNEYIAVKICAYKDELKLMVWDHGKEWDGVYLSRDLAEESLEQLNESLSAHGRGIPIISKIAVRISRQRYCDLNETTFVIPRNADEAAPSGKETEKAEK